MNYGKIIYNYFIIYIYIYIMSSNDCGGRLVYIDDELFWLILINIACTIGATMVVLKNKSTNYYYIVLIYIFIWMIILSLYYFLFKYRDNSLKAFNHVCMFILINNASLLGLGYMQPPDNCVGEANIYLPVLLIIFVNIINILLIVALIFDPKGSYEAGSGNRDFFNLANIITLYITYNLSKNKEPVALLRNQYDFIQQQKAQTQQQQQEQQALQDQQAILQAKALLDKQNMLNPQQKTGYW